MLKPRRDTHTTTHSPIVHVLIADIQKFAQHHITQGHGLHLVDAPIHNYCQWKYGGNVEIDIYRNNVVVAHDTELHYLAIHPLVELVIARFERMPPGTHTYTSLYLTVCDVLHAYAIHDPEHQGQRLSKKGKK